jgi:hypothetical protein
MLYLADCASTPLRHALRFRFHRSDGPPVHEQQVVGEPGAEGELTDGDASARA